MNELLGKNILMFVENDYEELELWYPKLRLQEAGANVVVAAPEANKIYRGKHGYPCKSDEKLDNMNEDSFDALVIPGGFAPDKLRRDKKVLDITKNIFYSGKLVAHICHAGWIPISAGIVNGFTCTSTPGIKDDLINAGAKWIDKACVVDRNMISSRRPDDLPEFCRAIIEFIQSK